MKLVVTSDSHFAFDSSQIPEGDVFIHCGDLLMGGGPEEWQSRLDSLSRLPHKHKYLVPGNHDFHIQIYEGIAVAELRSAGVKVVGLKDPIITLPNKMRMLGIPYITGLRGWAFNCAEEWLEDYLNNLMENEKPVDIVVSHSPVYGILDAMNPEGLTERTQEHVGGLSLNRWFYTQKVKPKYWFSGHIHESYGIDIVDGCNFYNVAMCDRNYEQTNAPMTVEIP